MFQSHLPCLWPVLLTTRHSTSACVEYSYVISMNDPEFVRYTYFRLFLVFFGGGMVVAAVLEEAVLSPLPGDTALALELSSSSEVDGVETIGVMWAIAGPI